MPIPHVLLSRLVLLTSAVSAYAWILLLDHDASLARTSIALGLLH